MGNLGDDPKQEGVCTASFIAKNYGTEEASFQVGSIVMAPEGTATRAQLAVIILRFANLAD